MSDGIAGQRALFVRVEGRVQGVGYRAFTAVEAAALGIRGWVVNREDGCVEAALLGPGDRLGDLVGRMRKGPPGAAVTSLDVRSIDHGRINEVPPGAHRF